MARTHEIPLLIVPPWINKYYILDLNEKKSFVRHAVENGLTVFIMSWVNANEEQGRKSFRRLHARRFPESRGSGDGSHRRRESQHHRLLHRRFAGGLRAGLIWRPRATRACNAATFFTTQVDFRDAGDLLVYVDDEQVNWIEGRMKDKGYLPGNRMADAFNLLRSNDLIWNYVVNNYMLGKDPAAFDLLYWNSDSTRMPAGVHSFYLRECYMHNKLSQGQMVFDNVRIDLSKVKIPVYNLACREDHIAPLPSVFKLGQYFGGETTLVVSAAPATSPAWSTHRRQHEISILDECEEGRNTLEDWLKGAKETPGSWWPHWVDWITSKQRRQGGTAPVPG